jgi:hypothetical protein
VRHCWRSRPLCGECCEARGAGWRERASGEPGPDPVEVEGRGGGDALQARLRQTAIARLAQAEVDPFWILLAKSSGCGWDGHEADKGGLAGSFAWRACEPVADAAKVYGSSREHMLQVGFSQLYVARPAQVQGAGAQ